MAAMGMSDVVVRNDAMLFTELDDVVVMMGVGEGRYYELHPVGTRVWALLETGRPVSEVCAEYDILPDICRSRRAGLPRRGRRP